MRVATHADWQVGEGGVHLVFASGMLRPKEAVLAATWAS